MSNDNLGTPTKEIDCKSSQYVYESKGAWDENFVVSTGRIEPTMNNPTFFTLSKELKKTALENIERYIYERRGRVVEENGLFCVSIETDDGFTILGYGSSFEKAVENLKSNILGCIKLTD